MRLLFKISSVCFLSFLVFSLAKGAALVYPPDSTLQVAEKVKDIVIYHDDRYYAAFPSIVRKPDGEFLLSFRRSPDRRNFGSKGYSHTDPNSYLVQMTSRDGINWSGEPELLYAHDFGGSQDPCLLQLSDGTLLCTSYGWTQISEADRKNLRTPNFVTGGGYVFLGGYVVRSSDGGKSWKGPYYPPHIQPEINFTPTGDPVPAYNRGALYEGKDGRVFWVVASHDQLSPSKTSNHLLISNDKGLTWQYSAPVAVDPEVVFNEASVYETPKGDVVAFIRTGKYDDQAVIARSTDGGKSFGPWKSMGFKGHPLQALRLPDNRVLLVYGYRHQPYGIRARILNAECTDFETAPEIILREDGGSTDIGYPWAVVLDEKHALVTYYFNKENQTRHIAGSIIRF
ncbi:MAG: exo-alpha-sialidase [Lunatimonas sp.]|uniref:sialidase family protein n=1 Tax=Lunatimonas sp. TaxID=2060141 RepID=UPI00263B3AE1|nr:sialidase family protein [Lunatimonas sp.]MCC5938323.1 exo-alpha-sialidase [Lunatimonas sp.]